MKEVIEVPNLNVKVAGEFQIKASNFYRDVTKMKVNTQQTYEFAAALRGDMKKMLKEVDEKRKAITSPLDVAKKAVMELFKPVETGLDNCIRHVDGLLISYTTGQEKIRLEQEEKLRKQAEAEERKQREAKEAQERAWREKQEAAQKEAERLAKAGKQAEAAKATAEAEKAAQKAEERRQQAAEVQVVAPTLASSVGKVEGLSFRTNWKMRILDVSLIPREYLIPDEKKLNNLSVSSQGSLKIPGVEFYSEKIPVNR